MPALPHCKHQVLKEKEKDEGGDGGEQEGVELRQIEKREAVDVCVGKGCAWYVRYSVTVFEAWESQQSQSLLKGLSAPF